MGKPSLVYNLDYMFIVYFIALLLRVSFLLLLSYPAASVNRTTIGIGGEDDSVSACIPVNRNTSLYMSLVDPSCDSKVDLYQSLPPRIKSYQVSFNVTSTGFIYNLTNLTANLGPEKLIILYVVSCKVAYSAEMDSSSLLCITIGAQISRCYSTKDNINSDSRRNITESGNITTFRPQDLLVQIVITKSNSFLNASGSIKIQQFYYENVSYPKECSNLTIDRPQCQLKSFTNETCIFAFSNNSVKLQYGNLLYNGSRSTYTQSMTTCLVYPTAIKPTGSEYGVQSVTLNFTLSAVILIIFGAIACIICFAIIGGYYNAKKNRHSLTRHSQHHVSMSIGLAALVPSNLMSPPCSIQNPFTYDEFDLAGSDELIPLERRKEADESRPQKKKKNNFAAEIKQIKGKNNF